LGPLHVFDTLAKLLGTIMNASENNGSNRYAYIVTKACWLWSEIFSPVTDEGSKQNTLELDFGFFAMYSSSRRPALFPGKRILTEKTRVWSPTRGFSSASGVKIPTGFGTSKVCVNGSSGGKTTEMP
jgi:hypothetical protein